MRTRLATPDQSYVELFNRKTGYFRDHRRKQLRNRYVFQSATHAANEVLMGINVRVEPAN